MISPSMLAILTSYAPTIQAWIEVGLIKQGIAGGDTQTSIFRATANPTLYLEPGRVFDYPWLEGSRITREAQELLNGTGSAISTITNGGTFTFPNHNHEIDSIFGADGWDTRGQIVTVGIVAQANPYVLSTAAQHMVLFQGIAREMERSDSEVRIVVEDLLSKLETARIASARITQTNFPNAEAAILGKSEKVLLGHCHGVELIEVDRLDRGGRFQVAGHQCPATGNTVFRRNGYPMSTGIDYIPNLNADDGKSYITLVNGRAGARITGDIEGVRPAHLGAFSARYTEVLLHVLSLAGISVSALDAAGIAALKAVYPWDVDYPIRTEISVKAAWETLTRGIPTVIDQRGQETFYLAPYEEPSGTPDLSLTDDTSILSHEIVEAPLFGGVRLTYAPYETTLSAAEIAGAVFADFPALAERLQEPSLNHTEIFADSPENADTLIFATRLIHLTDIKTLAQIHHTLSGWRHIDHRVQMTSVGAALEGIGSVLSLKRQRMGMEAGNLLTRILSLTQNWNTGGPVVDVIARQRSR